MDSISQTGLRFPVQSTSAKTTPVRTRTDDASPSIRRLVAARVSVDPTTEIRSAVETGTSPMAMYRHPADKNIAVTGIVAGRVLDVRA